MPAKTLEQILCLAQSPSVSVQIKLYKFDNYLYELKHTSLDSNLNALGIEGVQMFFNKDDALDAFNSIEKELITSQK